MVSMYTLMKRKDSKKKFNRVNGSTTFGGVADIWPNFNFAAIFWTLLYNKKC